MIDLEQYKDAEAVEVLTGSTSYDSDSWLNKTGLLPLMSRLFLSAFRFYVWKYAFYAALMVIGVGVANRDKIATNLANDGYVSAWNLFAKDQNLKSTITNHHPAYYSPIALKFKSKAGFDLRKLFWYVKHDSQELLVKRDVFRINEMDQFQHSTDPYLLEKHQFIGDDAIGICAGMAGWIPQNEAFLRTLTKKLHIKPHPGEMTQNSSNNTQLPFRCIIDPNVLMEVE
ncbi:MAG: hypothetical protein HOD85_33475 [Deltaproteobacteria bacterium]|jgi:hypothetical protein|nr:hypothetical protein [Deltaproteobacteria bacterium]MBT4639439.1 hypothetical protein [Deltaproteobacteria bacterium]